MEDKSTSRRASSRLIPAARYSREVRLLKLGRNDRCPCGSGLKYKKCCLG
ncbi:SEC-C metal-binding domain-containing protein [Cupriavidus sp. CP313]